MLQRQTVQSPIIEMMLINGVKKKRRIDGEENEGQACGSQKDNLNELAAANTTLERSKSLNRTMLQLPLLFRREKSLICFVWCFVKFIRQYESEKNR